MVGAGGKKDVSYNEVLAAVKNQQVRSLKIPFRGILARSGHVAFAGKKSGAVSINRTLTFDTNVLGICSGDHDDIAVVRRDPVAGFVVLPFRTAQQSTLRRQMQGQ